MPHLRWRSSRVAAGGTKLARISPCATRSAIYMASLTSVLRLSILRIVLRVGQDQFEVSPEYVPDRFPVHTGRIHGDMLQIVNYDGRRRIDSSEMQLALTCCLT
ncbi:hypothetical protein OKW26_002845 [Paraburkholderia sp. 32]